MLLRNKIILGVFGSLALVGGAAGTYKAVTGECPCAAISHMIHGDTTTTAAKPTTPPTAN